MVKFSMQTKIVSIVFSILFVSITNAQELSRTQKFEELRKESARLEQIERQHTIIKKKRDQLMTEILAVRNEDEIEAAKIGAKAIRLFPDKILDNLIPLVHFGFSVHSFTGIARYYSAPRIEYKRNKLRIVKEDENISYIASLGGTLPETVNGQTREVMALAKYQPPEDYKDAESELRIDGQTFGKSVPAIVGNTYILRGISYGQGDGIVVFKIHRKDSDGSIILFIKKLLDFPPPEVSAKDYREKNPPSQPEKIVPDLATQTAVQNALIKKGFYQVTVEATNAEVTLRGSVPKGKLGEAVRTAAEIGKRRVNNQLSEQ